MEIIREIYYKENNHDIFCGFFKLENNKGKIIWRWVSFYYIGDVIKLYKKRNLIKISQIFKDTTVRFEKSDLDLPEEVNGNNC